MFDGRIVKEGGPELVDQLEARGLRLDQRGGRRRPPDGHPAPTPPLVAVEFPTLDREGVVYLDTRRDVADAARRPRAMDDYYGHHRARVHRGVYPLAAEATELFEGARDRIAAFVAGRRRDTIFTATRPRRSTSSPARGAGATSAPATAIVLTEMEHHSNLVPVAARCARDGRELDWSAIDDDGAAAPRRARRACSPRGDVKVVAVAHVSNVLGTINPVAEIVRRARAAGAITRRRRRAGRPADPRRPRRDRRRLLRLDRAQGLRPDRRRRAARPPRAARGDAAVARRRPHDRLGVASRRSRWAEPPARFEAGTSAIAEAIGLGAAVDFLSGIGMDTVRAHELELIAYALERLGEVDGPHDPRPADADRARRARLLRARRRPPARRRRDPRPRGRLRARRPPLRPAAHAAPGRRAPRPARRSRVHTTARGHRRARRRPRRGPEDLRLGWTTCTARRSSSTTSGPTTGAPMDEPDLEFEDTQPAVRRRAEGMLQVGDDGTVEDVRFDGHGCAISQAAASMASDEVKGMRSTSCSGSTARSCSTCSASTSPRRG